MRASFTPQDAHQGWPGTVHGGIITALLYEIMENLMYRQGTITMMRGMEAKLRSPASVGKELLVEHPLPGHRRLSAQHRRCGEIFPFLRQTGGDEDLCVGERFDIRTNEEVVDFAGRDQEAHRPKGPQFTE